MGPVGILGGTFDPVHNAHLAMARAALEALALERVIWLPTGNPPYREPPVASAEHRVAMLRLVLEDEPRSVIDARELAPGASGYAVDTLASLHADLGPQVPLYLLLGADQYSKLDTWHRPTDLAKLCRIAVFARPGWPEPAGEAIRVPMPPLEVSATALRERIARGADVSAMLPPAVLRYIARHHLYGHP